MIGLALEGGGTKGSYQIGAYYAMKDCGLKFDGFCGTSIGSFNCALLACGKEKELLKFWETIDISNVLEFNPEYIGKLKRREIDLKFIKMTMKGAMNILKNRGLKINGLKKILEEHVNEEELRNSKKDYGLCTVRVKDLMPLYLFKEDMKKNTIHDYIMASCYLPFFKMEKQIDDNYYIDGGFYDNSPVNMLIDKGYKKVYVVRINVGLSINITRKLKKDIDVTYIKPSRNVGHMLELNESRVYDNIEMGYYDTIRILKHHDGYIYNFRPTKSYYFDFITRKIPIRKMRRIKNFFGVENAKEAVIKSVEYVMEKENIDYYHIYRIKKVIRNLKKYYLKKHFVYEFVGGLKFL